MSEKIYALLLRLYPARFRERFESEALQLYRDRLREERGWWRKLQLATDLLGDFVPGLVQAYRNTYATAASAAPWPAAGVPGFRTLEEEPLRPGSLAMGSLVAVGTLALFVFVMSHRTVFPFASANERLRAAPAGSETNDGAQAAAERMKERAQRADQMHACSFDKLEQHPGNIGYVQLKWFADPAACGAVADAVMDRLGETDAIIFDLRDNRGGYPEMVRRMASWLFDHPVAWYNPRATSAAQRATAPVAGSRITHKPVFVLISRRTFSGAEHFAYNLKMLKRATLVGERTSGASHAGTGAASNRVALAEPKPAWEGTGVEPDVKVDAAEALRTAEGMVKTGTRD